MIVVFETTLRVRLDGPGAASVERVEFTTNQTLATARVAPVDGPDGRIAETSFRIARVLESDLPLDVGLAARVAGRPETQVDRFVEIASP